jgi:hypothetical protein
MATRQPRRRRSHELMATDHALDREPDIFKSPDRRVVDVRCLLPGRCFGR